MSPRDAIVLAAGAGTRLGAHSAGLPKGLLRVGDSTLADRALRLLAEAGITRVVWVSGFAHDAYQAAFAGRREVTLAFNPEFASSSTLVSLLRGLRDTRGDVLVLESDIIFSASFLDEAKAGAPDQTLVSTPTGAGDEVWVGLKDERVFKMSKQRAEVPHPVGEFVGITRLSGAACAWLQSYAATLSRADRDQATYEADALVALSAVHPLHVRCVDGGKWGEIDDIAHFQRVTNQVLPRLRND